MIMYPTLFPIIEGEKVQIILRYHLTWEGGRKVRRMEGFLSSCTLRSQSKRVHTVQTSCIENLELYVQ